MREQFLERKLVELRHTLAWMDEVMANVSDSILVLGESWKVIFVNDAFADLLETDRIVLLGKTFWDIMPITQEGKPVRSLVDPAQMKIASIDSLNGIYDFKRESIHRKMMFTSKYVASLSQAVCVLDDVSAEVNAETALMRLHNEVGQLKAQIAKNS